VKNRAAIKAELIKKAERVIDELLDWHQATERANLSQVEEKVLELRQRLSEEMAVTVIEQQAAVRPVPGPRCGSCGQEMRYKGMKEKTVTSWVGALRLARGYYYCDRCRTGLFPPG
jgi:DNA repair exonuclease SbcCD ATPase subunit